MPLPRFFLARAEGLVVDLEHFQSSEEFRALVERLIAAGYFFRGLDYEAFVALLYDFEPGVALERVQRCKAQGKPAQLRWAAALRRFDEPRAALYHDVSRDGDGAVYLFERPVLQVEIEVEVADVVPEGEAAEADSEVPVGTHLETRLVEQETDLDADEFVAQLWRRGVRFGLDMVAIRSAIEQHTRGRVLIARGAPPAEGVDARVDELAEGLHRDDSPQLRSDGRVDLTQFRSHFPQVRAGMRLVKKVPHKPGVAGRAISGEQLDPPVPRNIDLASLAGAGTRIETAKDGEFLVAAINGFLTIDHATNQFSISEKIINKQGVNIRTTGNLTLTGDEYEEHGEIQEKRTVTGKSITTYADVYGRLVSTGGTITVKKNLSGGGAINRDGPVCVEGMAINAVISAPRGEICVRRAENCVLSGQRVVVLEQAVGCDIFGSEVSVADSEGSAIGGENVFIGVARQRGSNESLISLLLPDLVRFDREEQRLAASLKSLDEADERARSTAERAQSQPEVSRYLELARRLRSGEIKLKPEQTPVFDALSRKAAPVLKALGALSAEVEARKPQRAALLLEVEQIASLRREAGERVRCRIDEMNPGVVVRSLCRPADSPPLGELPPAELRAVLRASTAASQSLTQQSEGEFEWHFPGEG